MCARQFRLASVVASASQAAFLEIEQLISRQASSVWCNRGGVNHVHPISSPQGDTRAICAKWTRWQRTSGCKHALQTTPHRS